MAEQKKDIELGLLQKDYNNIQVITPPTLNSVTQNEYEYKEESAAPKVKFTGLTLIILCPLLIAAHIRAAAIARIPMIQFAFCTTLFAFLLNYTIIIRKYQLRPFLPENIYDSKLKRMCVLGVAGLIISMIWGWNGSGGILFAMAWESIRGNRFDFYGYMLAVIILGSLLMEQNFKWQKLIQFIPGVFFGFINSTLFTLRQSSVYAISHQFLLFTCIVVPMLFPAFHIVVPNIWQWILMIVGGVTLLFTTVLTIKLMQTERVSVVMGVMSGLLMIGTCDFSSTLDHIGIVVILVGVALIIKKQYLDVQY